jgi:hypothetical protein
MDTSCSNVLPGDRDACAQDDPWARLAGLPLGEAAAEVTYLLLGDPSNPAVDAEELEVLCHAGPEMGEAERKAYKEQLRAILVQEWTSWGHPPEAVDAMLAEEESRHLRT